MKKYTDNLIREINEGKNLEENMGRFSHKLMGTYHEYALIHMAMNYVTYYEVVKDKENSQTDKAAEFTDAINEIIRQMFAEHSDSGTMVKTAGELDRIRTEITKKMQILTAYTDIFQIYEYVLNRIEMKFKKEVLAVDDDAVASRLLRYIFDTKDNVVIHDKIKEVIGQLPVRMTKAKYFDLLSDSLSVYKGADKSSVDNYIYMIKTSAMLYHTEDMEKEFTDLGLFANTLSGVDYKNLDNIQFQALMDEIHQKAEFINELTDVYVALQEIVNNLYAVVLLMPYITAAEDETERICKDILIKINKNFNQDELPELQKEMFDSLVSTEGKQEALSYEFMMYESILYDIRTNHEELVNSLMLGAVYGCLTTCQKLLSSSLFIDLYETQKEEPADESYIALMTRKLTDEMGELFRKNDKLVNRAIMANTINKMPVFFHSTEEVSEYIKNSLFQCSDKEEKAACVSILEQLME